MREILLTVTPSKKFVSLMNRKRTTFALLVVGYMVWSEIKRHEQDEKIERLVSQVEVLEASKEEE